MVSTIHDLNFKYFFGAAIFTLEEALRLDRETGDWLARSQPVTSSQFMADDIRRFYPASNDVRIVRLAPFTSPDNGGFASDGSLPELSSPFVLAPTQMSAHKNVGTLIAAIHLLRGRYPGQ
jgi:hypothetical protein